MADATSTGTNPIWRITATAQDGADQDGGIAPDVIEFCLELGDIVTLVTFEGAQHVRAEDWERLLGQTDTEIEVPQDREEDEEGGARVRLDSKKCMLSFQTFTASTARGGGSTTVRVPQAACKSAIEGLAKQYRDRV